MDSIRLQTLFEKQLSKTLTGEEKTELKQFLADPGNEEAIKEVISNLYSAGGSEIHMDEEVSNEILQTIFTSKKPAKLIALSTQKNYFRLIAAASIMIIATLSVLFIFNRKNHVSTQTATIQNPSQIAPGQEGAVLTLSDGKQIILDKVSNGQVATDGGNSIIKNGAKIEYGAVNGSGQASYNTMTTPRGRTFQLTLSDGSKIWMNAASSIRYPTVFNSSERKVEISGEVYFEIAHDALKPFRVMVKNTEIEVLGTHFNVSAYSDESVMKATLLEGKIRLKENGGIALLKPGQQAQITNGNITLLDDPDLNQVMAWQRGLFEFNKTDLTTIMRQISRWYDIDVIYEQKPGDAKYGGGLSRNLPLSEVLKLLEYNGVKFRLEGEKIFVRP
jgi:transmembrane sensor